MTEDTYDAAVERVRDDIRTAFFELKKLVEIPFDQHLLISSNQFVYGEYHGKSERIGQNAKLFATTATILGGTSMDLPDTIGVVVGDIYGRVLLYIQERDVFIGWCNPDEFKMIELHVPTKSPAITDVPINAYGSTIH